MIKWEYEQMDMFTYWIQIEDKYGRKIYEHSNVSSPVMSLLKEILTDYTFALHINKTNSVFNYDNLSSEDKMDLKLFSLTKLEDIEDE
jgi:hypothetical protein